MNSILYSDNLIIAQNNRNEPKINTINAIFSKIGIPFDALEMIHEYTGLIIIPQMIIPQIGLSEI